MPALSSNLEFSVGTDTRSVTITYPYLATNTTVTYVSQPVKGAGYYHNASDGKHTSSYTVDKDFVGTITMQATLSLDPATTEWFDVDGTVYQWGEFENRQQSQTVLNNFDGNFVWVRGVMSIDQGTLESIRLNY